MLNFNKHSHHLSEFFRFHTIPIESMDASLRMLILRHISDKGNKYTTNLTGTFRGVSTIKLFSKYLNDKISLLEFIYLSNNHTIVRFMKEMNLGLIEPVNLKMIFAAFKKYEKELESYDYIEALDLYGCCAKYISDISCQFTRVSQRLLFTLNVILFNGNFNPGENYRSYRDPQLIETIYNNFQNIEAINNQFTKKYE